MASNFKKLALGLLVLLAPFVVYAQLNTVQGGTGSTSPSGLLYGDGSLHLKTASPGANCTFSGGVFNCTSSGSSGLSTTTPLSDSNLLTYSAAGSGKAYGTATSTLTAGTGLTGSFVQIGSTGTVALTVPVIVANGGTGSTTLASGQILYGSGTNSVGSVATTTVSCTGNASCTPFTIIGTTPISINAAGGAGSGLATTTPLSGGNLLEYTAAGSGAAFGVATSTPTVHAPITYSGTLGSFVGGVSGAFGCTTASGGVTGCLSGTDWTTFNNKQATISATWPIVLTGATLSFSGLATTTTWTPGNLAYVINGNTVAGVATSTLTPSSPLTGSFTQVGSGGSIGCQTASGSQAGCLSSADWTTFNGKGSGSVTSITTSNGVQGGTITTTGNISLISYIATATPETAGQLAYWGTTAGTPAKLNGVATSTLNAGTGLTGSFTQIGSGGTVALSVPVSIANGGTATTTGGVTNAVEFYNGTTLTNTPNFTTNGLGNATTSSTFGIGTDYGYHFNSAPDYLDLQNVGSAQPYTEARLLSNLAVAANGAESTYSMVVDCSGTNAFSNQNYFDHTTEAYPTSRQAILGVGASGTCAAMPLVIRDVPAGAGKDVNNHIIILPNGSTGFINAATSSVSTSTEVEIASSTAAEILEVEGTPGTASALGTSYLTVTGSNNTVGAGSVGIGTATPGQKLEVDGNILLNAAGTGLFILSRGATTNFSGLQFQTNQVSKWTFGGRNDSTDNFHFFNEGLSTDSATINITTNAFSILNASTTLLSNFKTAYFGGTATTTIDSAGNIVIPSGSSLTNTGVSNGCGTWASGVLGSTGSACGSSSGSPYPFPLNNNGTSTLVNFYANASTSQFTATSSTYLATLSGGVTIGTSTPQSRALFVEGSNGGGIVDYQRDAGNALFNSVYGTFLVSLMEATTSTNLASSTGPAFILRAATSTSGTVNLADIYATQDGSTNNNYAGALGLRTYLNGVASTDLTILSSGNVGIGSTTPGTLFSIGNTTGINFTTATSTFNSTGGTNILNGCYAVRGACLPNLSGGTEVPVGTVNGTNTVFTVTNVPVALFLNGGFQTAGGVDYTLTGSGPYTITYVTAPPTSSVQTSQYMTGLGAITSVTNSDGTLTISPSVGAVVASLALGHANTWTGQQTFNTSTAIFGVAPTFSAMTSGSVLFAGASGVLSQDNSNFFWNNTTKSLGIGTSTPWATLSVSTTTQSNASVALFAVASTTNATLFSVLGNGHVSIPNELTIRSMQAHRLS